MSYADKETAISRAPINLTVIKQDFCSNTFGVAPCTATGVECFNTYFTCKDKPNYAKIIKSYDHVNFDAPHNDTFRELNARPDLLSINFVGTELREDKTIPARATFTFQDGPDYDVGIDPYRSTRVPVLLNVPGNYWKKWIERNPYYKGRIIESWQGYDGLTKADFQIKFSGKMDNITREGNTVKIECIDDIVDLSNVKYPFKTNKTVAADYGACLAVSSEGAMLKLDMKENDFVLRSDFATISSVSTPQYNPASTLNGTYYYVIVAYDADDKPIAMSSAIVFVTEVGVYNEIVINWQMDINSGMPQARASYHRVYKTDDNGVTYNYLETAFLTITDNGNLSFPNAGVIPSTAYRMFKFYGGDRDPADLNNWTELTTAQTLELSAALTDTTGYIKIDDEIIYYNGITGTTLQNILRLQFKSKADAPHYAGTNIKLVTWKAPGNPFTILENLWLDSGIDASRIDYTTLHTLRDAWTGINFSTKPIIKDTDAAKLTADLCWALDVAYWVNEEGKLTARRYDNETTDYYITDAENIILDSKSIDFNQEDIITRILLYTNRNDVTKSGKDNYSNIYVELEASAEGPNMYDKELPIEKETTWVNDDCGTASEIETYVADLLNKKIKRGIVPRPKLSFDVDLKDSQIQVGHVVELTSDAFNDIEGYDYAGKKALVIKKEPGQSKIKLIVKLLATDAVTTTSEHHIQIFDNPKPVTTFNLNEVCVTGLSYYDSGGVRQTSVAGGEVNAENFLEIAWDNMYMSAQETALDITGVSHDLPRRKLEGPVDTSSWTTTRKYNLYIILLNAGETQSSLGRPGSSDTHGTWYLKATVPDIKNNDPDYVYKIKLTLPAAWLGRKIGFAVYADATLRYDLGHDISDPVGPLY